MKIREMQEQVSAFVHQHGMETDVPSRLLDVMSELGEVAKEALKATHYGKQPFECGQAWTDEMGDVLFSLICVANSTGIDLESAVGGALAKYAHRIGKRGTPASAPRG